MLHRKHITFNLRILALVAALGSAMIGALFVSAYIGVDLVHRHSPQVDASMLIKLELYKFHLSMDEYFEGDEEVDVQNVWTCLDESEWYANAMLVGGNAEEGYTILPLEDRRLRERIKLVIGDMDELRTAAMANLGRVGGAAPEGRRRFDTLFDRTVEDADDVEHGLWDLIRKHIWYHKILTGGLGVLCLALTFVMGVVLHRYESRKADYLVELEQSRYRLRESRERYRSLVETTNDWVWEVDKDGVFTYVSPNVRELLGYSADEVEGKTAFDLMSEDEVQHACDAFSEAAEKGEPIRQMVNTVVRKDGRSVVMEASGMPFFSEDGELIGYRGINRDVSERIRSEEELARVRKRLELLFACNPAVVHCCEAYGGFSSTYVSENVMDFGYSPDEFTRDPGLWTELIHPEDEPRVTAAMKKLPANGQPVQEYRFLHSDGSYKWVRDYINLIRDEHDRPLEIVGYMINIDEMKRLQKRKDEFYSMVSHDLKSPIAVIQGYAELVREGRVPEDELRGIAEAIQAGTGKLLRLVNDFLDIARLQEGKIELRRLPVDVNEMLSRAAKEFSLAAGRKELEFSVTTSEDLPRVELDETYAARAVANLVQNAVNYTPHGGRVSLAAARVIRNGAGFVAVTVADTGPGIPKDEQGEVFEMYYRCKNTAGVKGSGLGLAIVKAVAEAHGGRVELVSEEGKGCEFTLLFPISDGRSA